MIPFKTYAPLTLLCLASLTIADSAAARAGGGVSVGRASSTSVTRSTPSYTAPRPSFTTPRPVPAPVPRPAPRLETPMIPAAPRPPVPAVAPAAQSSSSSNAFLKGLAGGVVGAAVFSALTPNHSTTVVAPVAPAPMAAPMAGAATAMTAAPVAYQVDNGLPWGSILLTTLILSGLGAAAYYARKDWLMRREVVAMTPAGNEVKHLPEFPLDFFYDVQRAAMNGDVGAMTKLCSSPGLAQALMDKTENVDVHEIFTGVTWEPRSGDTLAFSFRDDGTPVTELWFFSYGRLDGISVV